MGSCISLINEKGKELLLSICLFVDKIFQTVRSVGGNDKGFSVEIFSMLENSNDLMDLMSFCSPVGPWEPQ